MAATLDARLAMLMRAKMLADLEAKYMVEISYRGVEFGERLARGFD